VAVAADDLLREIRAAYWRARSGAITDDYERGRVHALDDVYRTFPSLAAEAVVIEVES
jgi:phytoene/squalene synthetase